MKDFHHISRLITTKSLAILMCSTLLISIIPLLVVGYYNIPSADDYTHSASAYSDWSENHSIISLVKITQNYVINSLYNGFTGLYAIGIIPLTSPFVLNNYWIIAYITILPLCLCVMFLLFSIFRRVFHADYWTSLLISATTALCAIQTVPSAVESFYWHAGATTYTTATALFFLVIGLTILNKHNENKSFSIIYAILSSFMIIIYTGSNFITGLANTEFFILLVIASVLFKYKKMKIVYIPAAVSIISFFITLVAPGNAYRQTVIISQGTLVPNTPKAIMMSLLYGVYYPLVEVSPLVWLCVLFLVPFFFKVAANSNFKFKYPGIVVVLSYLGFSSLACPHFRAAGSPGPGRVVGVYSYIIIVLLVLNIFYCIGWVSKNALNRKISLNLKIQGEDATVEMRNTIEVILLNLFRKCALIGLFALLLSFTFISATSIRDGSIRQYTTPAAVGDLRSRRAIQYHMEYQARLDILNNPEIKEVIFEPYSVRPTTLFFTDIEYDSSNWKNNGIRRAYNKNSIVLIEPENNSD